MHSLSPRPSFSVLHSILKRSIPPVYEMKVGSLNQDIMHGPSCTYWYSYRLCTLILYVYTSEMM